ncbi:hypothetical protein HAX54_021799, partial [Datura stramonium]|nr:hypothetical protein [Datura stramonium]
VNRIETSDWYTNCGFVSTQTGENSSSNGSKPGAKTTQVAYDIYSGRIDLVYGYDVFSIMIMLVYGCDIFILVHLSIIELLYSCDVFIFDALELKLSSCMVVTSTVAH